MARTPRRAQHARKQAPTRAVASLLGIALVSAAGLGAWWLTDEETTAPGTYVAPSEISTSSRTSEPSATSSRTSRRSASSSSSSSTTPARRSTSTTTPPAPSATAAPAGDPTRVTVTSGGRTLVDASLQATYLDADDVLAPPFGTAGWYAESGWPKPGQTGASILVGHINHGSEPDVFWNLPQVKIGDRVTVTYGSGREVAWRITRSSAASKTEVPQDDTIWDHDNPRPVLRLITCDPTTPLQGGHYEGNWVVWADPA